MRQLQSGRPVSPDDWKKAKQGLQTFLKSAAAMVAGGLKLSGDAQEAQAYLSGLNRLEDSAEIKRAMDTIETELRIQYQGAESLTFDNQLETVAALRAQATIVKSILDAYEKANGGALSPIADLLVRRVAREAFEKSKTEDLSSDKNFVSFLNQIQEAAENGNILRLLDRESGQRESVTLKYIIERLVGALNESIKKLYKDRSSKIGGRYKDVFNREEIDTYDSFLAVGKWLAELKDEKNIDPSLRSQLVAELEKMERSFAEKLEKLRGQRYPSATPGSSRAPAEPTSFSASFDLGGNKSLGGMTSSVGIDATAAGAFAAIKPEVRKPKQNTAIDFKFKDGKFTLPMAEAFANDVFYDFFKKFDEQRNPGEEFDAANPSHHERYEKAVEGYRLWMEALGVFTKQAKEIIQQDLGIKADLADFVAFEDELEQLVIEDTQKVRGMIDKISEYNRLEEDEARKENELIDLGGFEKLKIQVDELQILRQEKKFEAEALIARLTDFAKSRSPYSRAREFKNRTTWQKAKVPQNEGFWAKLKRKASDATGSLMWKFKGLLTFKESHNLEKELQKTYGMDIDTAAEYFPELAKLEERMQAQTEAAIREYERIEKMYHELKSKVATIERAQQEKDLISSRFNQLRLGIFSNTQAFKTVARLTAGRSRDIIKGMLDGAGASDEQLGEAVKKSEVQLEGLRRAANFKFGGDRYTDIPEIAETLGAEGSVIAEADSVITEAVKKRIQKVVEQTTTVNNQGTLLIRKAFLAYGKRGYEVGEQVLSEAIKKAKDANNGRRANQLQALLFELRALKG
jgi:ribosome-binding factor A